MDDPTGIVGPGCANVVDWVGCDGSFNGTDGTSYLIADICTVSCESCSSGPTGCDLPDMSLSILDDGSVLYNTSEAIGGFQFVVEGDDVVVNGVSGGAAEAAGFSISGSSETNKVLGFSLTGTTIPPGCGTLVEVELEGIPTGLTEILITDLEFEYVDPPIIDGCMLPDMNLLMLPDGSVLYNTSEAIGGFQFYVFECALYNYQSVLDAWNIEENDSQISCEKDYHCQWDGATCSNPAYTTEQVCIYAGSCSDPVYTTEQACVGPNDNNGTCSDSSITQEDPCGNSGAMWTYNEWTGESNSWYNGSCMEQDGNGVVVNGVSGGAAEAAGFSLELWSATNKVLGFSLTGASVPPGCGTLVEVELYGIPTGLSGVLVSDSPEDDQDALDLGFSYYCATEYDCAGICGGTAAVDICGMCRIESSEDEDGCCVDPVAPNYTGSADCDGECGGSAVADECGECGGNGSSCSSIPGCTDYTACNYNPDATEDDGSCLFDDCAGVCDGTSELDECGECGGDGSSCSSVPGCMDNSACNYNADATEDDGSCEYAEDNYDCDGNCIATGDHLDNGLDCSGVCGGSAVVDECGVCGGDGSPGEGLECDGTPLEFVHTESQIQAYYFFTLATIDGASLHADDWVGAFNGDVCVGARRWGNCGGGTCDVPVMGVSSANGTEEYCTMGDVPTFRIYDASENKYAAASPSEEYSWIPDNYLYIDSITADCPFVPVCLDIIQQETGICSNPAIPEEYCENIPGNIWFTGTMDIHMINQPGCTYYEGTTEIFSNVMTEAECGSLNCTDPQYTTEEECEAATEEWDQYQGVWFDGNVLGFQFIVSTENITIQDNSIIGGTAFDLNYTINLIPDYQDDVDFDGTEEILGTMLLGFSLTGTPIPPGEGALVTVGFTDYNENSICFKQYCSGAAGNNTCTNAIIGNIYDENIMLDADWSECYCGDADNTDNPWCSAITTDGEYSTLAWDNEDQCLCGEDGSWDDANSTCTFGNYTANAWNTAMDCEYVCGGTTAVDCDGRCGGALVGWCSLGEDCGDEDTNNPLTETWCTFEDFCEDDMGGVWHSEIIFLVDDNCGNCNGDCNGEAGEECGIVDCFGNCVVGEDACNTCGGDGYNSNNYGDCECADVGDVFADCAGVCDGDKLADQCGTCDADTSNDCALACDGVWGGDAVVDECNVCGGDGSSCSSSPGCMDNSACNYNPDATEDDGSCAYELDCAGICGGDSYEDNCGDCDADSSNDCVQPPEWQDDPGAYQLIASMTAAVYNEQGAMFAAAGDILAAFDDDGNVRGVADENLGHFIPSVGPFTGQILFAMTIRAGSDDPDGGPMVGGPGDHITFKFYDASENAVLNILEDYSFVINDIIGHAINPHVLNVGTSYPTEPECVDDDAGIGGAGCAWAIGMFGCDFAWGGATIGELCPLSCNSCPDYSAETGCMDPDATNYDGSAVYHDESSCLYPTSFVYSDEQQVARGTVAEVLIRLHPNDNEIDGLTFAVDIAANGNFADIAEDLDIETLIPGADALITQTGNGQASILLSNLGSISGEDVIIANLLIPVPEGTENGDTYALSFTSVSGSTADYEYVEMVDYLNTTLTVITAPPEIDGLVDVYMLENSAVTLGFNVSDLDGTEISMELTGAPDYVTLNYNTGEESGSIDIRAEQEQG